MNLQAWIEKGKEKVLSLGVKQWGMFLVAGLCCLVIVFPMGDKKESESVGERREEKQFEDNEEISYLEEETYVAQLEKRLTGILSDVENVGEVKVMITVESTVQKSILRDGSYEKESVTETDSAGGSRITLEEKREETTVFYDIEGTSTPYILSETYPKITGVVVIAKGCGTGSVDLDILNAVQVLFDVPAHKIKIMKMK